MGLVNGAIILDKPAGVTSFKAVSRLRGLLGGLRSGHLGTLDPLGTGVLPVLVGRATRLARFYLDHSREYVATVRFGWATSTYDAEGEPLSDPSEVTLDRAALDASLGQFRGSISQVPPPVSAKKVGGVRAYRLARKQRPVELDPSQVSIEELELLDVSGASATLRCVCSAGTYIRSLAHDLGTELGCGAHVAELRRTRVGEFSIEDASTFEELESLSAGEILSRALVPAAELVPSLPVHRVDSTEAAKIRHGQQFRVSPFSAGSSARIVKAIDPRGELLCVARAVGPRMFHPFVVF